MDASTAPVAYFPAPATGNVGPAQGSKPATPDAKGSDSGLSFHDVLSALNPLQYLPVVGTIYRAVTGDTIPEGLRIAGSFVVSALTGGPLGVLLNAAVTIAERLTGIDPEAIARDVAGSLGVGPTNPLPRAARPVEEAGPVPSQPAPPITTALAPKASPVDAAALDWLPAADRRLAGLASYARFAIG